MTGLWKVSQEEIYMNRIFAYIVVLLLACSACTGLEMHENDGSIRLSVCVDKVDVSTRGTQVAHPFEGTVPSPSNPLETALLFSMTSGVYQHSPALPTCLPCHTTIKYENAVPKDPDPWEGHNLKYPTDDAPVYCVGLCPKTGWAISDDGRTATYDALDGFTDVMFSQQISGSWSSHFGVQTYDHLLTWLKVCLVAVDAEAPQFWGNVRKVSIETESQVDIVLYDAESADSKVSYSGSIEPLVYEGDYELTTSIFEVGSVLCAPALSYTLKVQTEKEERTVEAALVNSSGELLNSLSEAAGRQFVIELYFHPFSVIEGECSLASWEYKGENFYLK